jgi:uncharacterized repeat protein (TIGR03803 family)
MTKSLWRLVEGNNGEFYGTTRNGGTAGGGTVFTINTSVSAMQCSKRYRHPEAGLALGGLPDISAARDSTGRKRRISSPDSVTTIENTCNERTVLSPSVCMEPRHRTKADAFTFSEPGHETPGPDVQDA